MRLLYVDLRPHSENIHIHKVLSSRTRLNFKGRVWSHHLLIESFTESIKDPSISLDYHNAAENLSLPDGYDGYILGGRGRNNYSSVPISEFNAWRLSFIDLLSNEIAKGKRILGICFGHHLLGQAAGFDLEALRKREFGIREYNLFSEPVRLIHAHGNALFRPPLIEDLDVSLYSGYVSYFNLRNISGIQAHPEYGCSSTGMFTFLSLYVPSEQWADYVRSFSTIYLASTFVFRELLKLTFDV